MWICPMYTNYDSNTMENPGTHLAVKCDVYITQELVLPPFIAFKEHKTGYALGIRTYRLSKYTYKYAYTGVVMLHV